MKFPAKSETMFAINLLGCCGTLLLLVNLSAVSGIVDESKPDLSVYKLRPVSAEQIDDSHAIRDYSVGAILLRRSLFTGDSQTRCSAYAHLLKLIRRVTRGEPSSTSAPNQQLELRLDTLVALATVVDAERELYARLLKSYQPESLRETFKEAIEQLERRRIQTPASKDTWLELIDCATHLQLDLENFLARPNRAKQIASYRAFKQAPARSDAIIGRGESGPSLVFSVDEIREARAKVEQLDDEPLQQLRSVLRKQAEPGEADRESDKLPSSEPATDATTERPPARREDDQDAPSANGQLEMELALPSRKGTPARSGPDDVLAEHHLTVLNFLKRRVELLDSMPAAAVASIRKESKLTVESAIDYKNHWNDLSQLKLDSSSELGKRVRNFLRDPKSVRVLERLGRIEANFAQLYSEMRTMRPEHRYESMEELNATYERMIKSLSQVDRLVDIYDMSRALMNNRERELAEFKAINRFIEDELW